MLKFWYAKYIRSKFFARILALNTIIVLLMMTLLVSLISRSVADQLTDKELTFNTQILESVNSYYERKLAVVRQMIEQIYYDPSSYSYLFDLMEKEIIGGYEYQAGKTKLESYFISSFTRDADMANIAIYSKLNNQSFLYSTNFWRIQDFNFYRTLDWFEDYNDQLYGLHVTPAYEDPFSTGQSRKVFTIGSNLLSREMSGQAGVLLVNFDADAVSNAFLPYKDRVKGTILIVDRDGMVIFSSSSNYAPLEKELQRMILQSGGSKTSIAGPSGIVNILPAENGAYIVGIIGDKELYAEVNQLTRNIFWLGLVCAAFTILLNGAGMSIFTQKVKRILRAIGHTPEGFLQRKTPLDVSDDEFGQIAFRFNQLQDKLNGYIDQVYVADIKYKNAALAALQAQINPHFLSNTLEAIRMKAIKDGNEDVAEMIYNLSFLLRTSLKHALWVSIKEEIAYGELYLQLFAFRYPSRLNIDIDIDKEIEHLAVGKLTLQPIIENSILHGVDFKRKDNRIIIRGTLAEGIIRIRIEDNGKGMTKDELAAIRRRLISDGDEEEHSDSIGLLNVHERIRLQFGERYGLELESGDGGTTVTVVFPARRLSEITEHRGGGG